MTIFGCATVLDEHEYHDEALKLRNEAIGLSKKGWTGLAISKMKESVNKAGEIGGVTDLLIEGYDELGLYYYEIGDYENSVKFQAVAVLLSYSYDNKSRMNKAYIKRLSWAFKKYDPTYNFSNIEDNPLNLICKNILNLRKNSDIRDVFYRSHYHPKKTSRRKTVLKSGWCNA